MVPGTYLGFLPNTIFLTPILNSCVTHRFLRNRSTCPEWSHMHPLLYSLSHRLPRPCEAWDCMLCAASATTMNDSRLGISAQTFPC